MLHERQEGRQPLAGSKFQGNSKTGPSNSWAFRATQPPPPPRPHSIPWHCHPGSMYSAGAQSEGSVSPRGSLLQHSRLPDVGASGPRRGGSTGPGLGYHAPPTLPQTPTTYTHGEDYVGIPHPRVWEPGEKPASASRFRIHKGDVLGFRSVGLFGLNGQRMEKSVFLTTMHYLK